MVDMDHANWKIETFQHQKFTHKMVCAQEFFEGSDFALYTLTQNTLDTYIYFLHPIFLETETFKQKFYTEKNQSQTR